MSDRVSTIDSPTELRAACFSPLSRPTLYGRGQARQARSRITNRYQRNSTCGQTPARRSQRRVARTLTYDSFPEHSLAQSLTCECSPETPSTNPSPSSDPSMATNRVFIIDYQRPRPIPERRRRRRSNSPDSDPELDHAPRDRTIRSTITRLLNHARLHLLINEHAMRCSTCGLLPMPPVTGMCGHTRCSGCIRRHPKCPCGVTHKNWRSSVNVLAQDFIQKLLATDQDLRQWLRDMREPNPLLQDQFFMMTVPPPHAYANNLYVNLPPDAYESTGSARNTGQVNGAMPAEAGMEEGAWALPEANYRRNIDEGPKNRVPITADARLQYGTYLVEKGRCRQAVPHLVRAALDAQLARSARRVLTQALLDLSRDHVLGEIEGEFRLAIRSQAASNWLSARDLECVLCFETYLQPITTHCGHTFCRSCLERSLHYRNSCALCMKALEPFKVDRVGINKFLVSIVKSVGLERVQRPMDPEVIPILACTVAFPGMPCPLFLFDPRYWYMIRRILESNSRTFGLVAYEREGTHSEYGTILEIRDCVHLQDGCTIVSTVGLSRFRVTERSVWDGWCDVARIDTITDIPVESDETVAELQHLARVIAYKAAIWIGGICPELHAKIEAAFGPVPCFDTRGCWWTLPDGPEWLWWLISILPLKLEIKILILATNNLLKRMRAVLRTLDTSLAQPPHNDREYEFALADWWVQRHL